MNGITVNITSQSDIIAARRAAREQAREIGFGTANQTRLATAVSELARNVLQHAGGGTCIINDKSDQVFMRIGVILQDHGPGIPDIERAMQDGFSTAGSLGTGLPGVKRIMHKFDITSQPGHTTVTIEIARRRV